MEFGEELSEHYLLERFMSAKVGKRRVRPENARVTAAYKIRQK